MDHSDLATPYYPYSWHQSHDQATLLIIVPHSVNEEQVEIVLDREHLVAGVRGQEPVVKGKLYGPVDHINSVWQLEPRLDRSQRREHRTRTISATSTVSSQSSYAYISEPELSGSFAASLEHNLSTDGEWETPTSASSPLSSPRTSSGDEQLGYHPVSTRRIQRDNSRAVSPTSLGIPSSFASTFSSVEDLHRDSRAGRLLTLHLEKAESGIWPSLISGPAPPSVSPCLPGPPGTDPALEDAFNMDPTSLTLAGLELYDIRKKKEAAFEFFVRAWLQSRVPSATLRLATYYAPPYPGYSSSEVTLTTADVDASPPAPAPGTNEYYIQLLGGADAIAQLYLEAGLLYLEGSAPALLQSSSSSHSLSSIRLPSSSSAPSSPGGANTVRSAAPLFSRTNSANASAAWRRDRQAARLFFDRARAFRPGMEVPFLPTDDDGPGAIGLDASLKMPTIDLSASTSSSLSEEETVLHPRPRGRRRREAAVEEAKEAALLKAGLGAMEKVSARASAYRDELDEQSWLYHVPSILGTGTAIVAVAVIGALSFSTWRKNHN